MLGFSQRICEASRGLRCGYDTLLCLLGRGRLRGRLLACLKPARLASLVPDAALQACRLWQAGMLLLPGFVGALWAVYRSERRLRLAFLREAREARLARAMPSDLDFLLNFAMPATLALWVYAW